MAAAFVKTVGTCDAYNQYTPGNFISGPVSQPAFAGNLLVLGVVASNTSVTAPFVDSIGRPSGETASWVQLGYVDAVTIAPGVSTRLEVWTITPTFEWSAGFSLGVRLSTGVRGKQWILDEYSGLVPEFRDSVSGVHRTNGYVGGNLQSTPGDVLIAFFGHVGGTGLAVEGFTEWNFNSRVGPGYDPSLGTAIASYHTMANSTSKSIQAKLTTSSRNVTVFAASLMSSATNSPWSFWNGTEEVPVNLDGVWDGSTIVPATYEGVL